jgi:GT2 family glycosyltransferase/peptidoglycan/xylan/chitin deacetylase (PgdA/CDA1 family)
MNSSVVIPTWRRAALLAETLDSLAGQTEADFDVIVVCDGEDPETRALAEGYAARYPLRWVFSPENRGRSLARNAGAQEATSDLLLFLDDDTPAAPDWVFQHRKRHRARQGGDEVAVCGRIVETYAEAPASHTEGFLRGFRNDLLAQAEAGHIRGGIDFDRYACFGVNCSIRRSVFWAVGGFHPAPHYRREDYELGTRLYDSGIRFEYEPCAVVFHRNSKQLADYFLQMAEVIGRSDLHRVRVKRQRNAQTRRLAGLHSGPAWRRLAHRLTWEFPDLFQGAAAVCRKATDATGWKSFFWLWRRLAVVGYWEGVKSAGETLDSVRRLVPPSTATLVFHSISPPTQRRQRARYLSPRRFSLFMGWLKAAGFESVLPTEWLAGAALAPSVMLTFDDGYDDFYSESFPTLARYGLSATLFVVVDRIGKSNAWDEVMGRRSRRLLSLEQIRELHRHKVQIGSHTLTHSFLTRLPDAELHREVRGSKSKLEDLLGAEVSCFAYPWGDVDARVRGAVARAGYKIGMTTQEGLNCFHDPLCLKRTNVAEVDTLMEFALKLATGYDLRRKILEWLS